MRHAKLSWIIGAVLFALLAAPFMGLAHQQAQQNVQKHRHYTLVDLGTLGGPNSFSNGGVVLNNNGTATGLAETDVFDQSLGSNEVHAFKWDNGVMKDLGTLRHGNFSGGQAINSLGVIVGFSSTTGIVNPLDGYPDLVATLWKTNGQIVNLGTLGGARSSAVSINDQGRVVGGATNSIPDPLNLGAHNVNTPQLSPALTQWHAALWQNGKIQDLGTLKKGTFSFANVVNAFGQVAGFSTTNTVINPTTGFPTTVPFFWEKGHMVNIGSLGGVNGNAFWMNNLGQVVGFSALAGDGDEVDHAFLWEKGHMKDLGTLGGCCSSAGWINDAGDIVGGANLPGDEARHAVLWKHGVITDLGSVCEGANNSFAHFINALGQVVGGAFPCDPGGEHPFLWENGGPAVDLNEFVPSNSDLILIEIEGINDSGVIDALGVLPNGDVRDVLLIPDDSFHGSDVAAVTGGATKTTHSGWTPEQLAKVRARFANPHRGFGLRLPKKSN